MASFPSYSWNNSFLLVLFGLLSPISNFVQMDGRPGYFYGLFTTNAVFDDFSRNAGFYDEPGALAFWGIFALLLNKLYINNRKIEYLLLFGLISTLSMAYFIQIAVYIFFFYYKQLNKILLPTFFFIIILLGLASNSEFLDIAIFGRFEINDQTPIIW